MYNITLSTTELFKHVTVLCMNTTVSVRYYIVVHQKAKSLQALTSELHLTLQSSPQDVAFINRCVLKINLVIQLAHPLLNVTTYLLKPDRTDTRYSNIVNFFLQCFLSYSDGTYSLDILLDPKILSIINILILHVTYIIMHKADFHIVK